MSTTVDLDPDTHALLSELAGQDSAAQSATIRSALTFWRFTSHGVHDVAQDVLQSPQQQTYVEALAETTRRHGTLTPESLNGLAGLIATIQTGSSTSQSDPVRDVFNPLLIWASEDKPRRGVTMSVTTVQPRPGEPLIATAWGTLSSDGPQSLYGTLEQRFSDRVTSTGAGFDASRTDRLGVIIAMPPAEPAAVILSLDSWGGGKQTLRDLRSVSNGLIGVGPGIGGRSEAAVHFITLGRFDIPG
ncbi:hypothetical protein GA707_07515 [Nostocoides sp. F2B08]|uniref:hypothetical protein n=1 Tax=Nostocoides sp. F2B08 TaxID=2653936 RepID=UPI001263CA1D|nr:hypothetical protein [Tetrasphaera sp. F2B08]KAB7744463.1 hypothetical protein GA707_07515 [Tetrasphaera sp. F2B08]